MFPLVYGAWVDKALPRDINLPGTRCEELLNRAKFLVLGDVQRERLAFLPEMPRETQVCAILRDVFGYPAFQFV